MRPTAPRLVQSLTLALLTGCAVVGADATAPRVAPTRPGATRSAPVVANDKPAATPAPAKPPSPRKPVAKVDLVNLNEVAARLGLTLSADPKGEKLTLTERGRRMELEVDSREVLVDGLRVFLGGPVRAGRGDFWVSKADYTGCLAPMLRPSLIAPRPPRVRVIAIDPGHGGADNGMENATLGLKEKVLTLDVAERLKKLLEARGYKVMLTRKDDRALHPEKAKDFERRIDLANDAGADVFVSIHFNSLYPDKKTGGTEVYTFTRAGQRSDRSWGFGQEDDAERAPSPVNQFDAASALLAHSIHRATIGELKTVDRGHKTMHSVVLRGLVCPAVLVESVFLSNDREGRLAGTPAYRQRIAAAMAEGIEDYAGAIEGLHAKR